MNRFDIAKKPIIIKEDQPEPESESLPVAPIIPEPDGLAFFNFRRGDLSYEDFYKTFTEISKLDKVLNPICPSDLADLFAKIEGKNLRVDSILVNYHRHKARGFKPETLNR